MLLIILTAYAASGFAQQQNLTDAQRMDLVGPVRSVSATTSETGIVFQQPGGPALVMSVLCRECEFDQDGNLTKSGQTLDGTFRGEIIQVIRDANGRVTERFARDDSTGELTRHEVIGPFGKTEEAFYQHGGLWWHGLFTYDQYGHMIDSLTLDGHGKQIGHIVVNIENEGNNKEEWDFGRDGEEVLHFQQRFDPKTQIEHFISFNPFGAVKLRWTAIGGTLSTFWELPGSQSEYGEGFSEDIGNDYARNVSMP